MAAQPVCWDFDVALKPRRAEIMLNGKETALKWSRSLSTTHRQREHPRRVGAGAWRMPEFYFVRFLANHCSFVPTSLRSSAKRHSPAAGFGGMDGLAAKADKTRAAREKTFQFHLMPPRNTENSEMKSVELKMSMAFNALSSAAIKPSVVCSFASSAGFSSSAGMVLLVSGPMEAI